MMGVVGGGWFASWKWFDVSAKEKENFYGKLLHRLGEGVIFDEFIE